MDRPPEKAYDLSVRVEGEDGKANWYTAGNILQAPPTPSIKVTQPIKDLFAKAPLNSWVNFVARRPRDRERDR